MSTPADRTVPRHRWVLAAALIALAALPVVLRYLVFWPLDQWQVDVEVYREAGSRSSPGGRSTPRSPSPQLLPVHLPAVRRGPRHPARARAVRGRGVALDGLQVLATTAIVWYAGYRLIHRAGAWVPLASSPSPPRCSGCTR